MSLLNEKQIDAVTESEWYVPLEQAEPFGVFPGGGILWRKDVTDAGIKDGRYYPVYVFTDETKRAMSFIGYGSLPSLREFSAGSSEPEITSKYIIVGNYVLLPTVAKWFTIAEYFSGPRTR